MTNTTKSGLKVNPYLFLDGRCEEAIHYYQKALGAELLSLMRFKESPSPENNPPNAGEKVMHASIRIGETEIMLSDGQCQGKTRFEGISLTLTAQSVEQGEKLFAALSDGGQVQMPFGKTFFSPGFGMVTDRLGITWMLVVAQS